MRYGVAIARGNLYEPGTYTVRRLVEWPHWTPTQSMIERDPENARWADGMEPGPTNALGSRAIYLYVGQRDTYLRIHGTPPPRSIGGRASSGCVRMVMAHINALYPNVEIGSTVYLYSASTAWSPPANSQSIVDDCEQMKTALMNSGPFLFVMPLRAVECRWDGCQQSEAAEVSFQPGHCACTNSNCLQDAGRLT